MKKLIMGKMNKEKQYNIWNNKWIRMKLQKER